MTCDTHTRILLAGRVGGAVTWGLGSVRVARTQDFTSCDMQALDSGCMSALEKALEGEFAWQVLQNETSVFKYLSWRVEMLELRLWNGYGFEPFKGL